MLPLNCQPRAKSNTKDSLRVRAAQNTKQGPDVTNALASKVKMMRELVVYVCILRILWVLFKLTNNMAITRHKTIMQFL